jgi:ubiquinone/menaquinone biosynthesis C-methylase UbiE
MKKLSTQEMSARYYAKLGSRLGYKLVMKKSQHFGYYDEQHTNEDAAQEKYHENLNDILKLKSGMKVLDAGCGQGVVATYLAMNNDVHITGITITPHEVKTATKFARLHRVSEKTSFVLADYAAIPFEDGSFDRVYTTESLSHAPDVNKVIKELARVLRPGGLLVCAEYEMDHKNFDQKTARLAKLIKEHAAIHGIYQFGNGDFKKILDGNKLKILHEYNWTNNVKPSFDRLRRLARPMVGIVNSLRMEKRFINVVAAAMYSDGVESQVFAYKVYVAKK